MIFFRMNGHHFESFLRKLLAYELDLGLCKGKLCAKFYSSTSKHVLVICHFHLGSAIGALAISYKNNLKEIEANPIFVICLCLCSTK